MSGLCVAEVSAAAFESSEGVSARDSRAVPPSKRSPWTGFRTSFANAAPSAETANVVKLSP